MRRIVLASHGGLANGLADSAHMIIGALADALETYSLQPGADARDYSGLLEEQIKNGQDTDFVILTDLFGASVCNAMLPLTVHKNVWLFSGMNLPMVMELLSDDSEHMSEALAQSLQEESSFGVRYLPGIQLNEREDF